MMRWGEGVGRRCLSAAPLVVGVAVLVGLCWQFGLGELAAAFGRVSPAYLSAYMVLAAVVLVGYSLRWGAAARALGARLPLARLVAARLAGDAVGALVPSAKLAGEPVRIALMYAGGVGGTQAGAAVTIDRALELISNMLCVLAYVAVFSVAQVLGSSQRAALILVLTILALLGLLALPLAQLRRGRRPLAWCYSERARRMLPRSASWMPALRRTEEHMVGFFRDHPATFVSGLAGSLLIEVLVIGEYYCLLAGFGVVLDLPTLLMVLLGTGVARAAPSPAGLGALEAGQVGVLAFAGGRPELGFVVGVVIRLHESAWMAAGLLVLSAQGLTLSRLRLAAAQKAAA
ncbi:MAG: flippase-like domain-containing protein [Deltaproteobacteria bacterium]|nr:flippase-like domain-containing protein [Deltaproteobacteria bacterium]